MLTVSFGGFVFVNVHVTVSLRETLIVAVRLGTSPLDGVTFASSHEMPVRFQPVGFTSSRIVY